MNRKNRTRVLVEGSAELLERMALEAQRERKAEMVRKPDQELVMLKVREDAQRSLFYLGEALMTSCTVRLGDAFGYGMVLGEDENKAYQLAVVDAAYACGDASLPLGEWDALLEEEQARLEDEQLLRNAALLRTQVDFSTMDEL